MAALAAAKPPLCRAGESTGAPPATQPAAREPAFGAMAYYDQSCSNCHGPQGSFYGPTLGKNLTDAKLRQVVKDMAEGPGNAPLQPDQVDCETAFHRALILRTPYVSLTTMSHEQWAGEAMPGATVTVQIAGRKLTAAMDDWNWTVSIPTGIEATPANATITAELDGKTTTLNPAKHMYSHVEALPPLAERKR
jgi:hypothetical protein